jgi:hypothetical protein
MATTAMLDPVAPPEEDHEEERLWRWKHFCLHEVGHGVGALAISAELGLKSPLQTIVATKDKAIAIEWIPSPDLSAQDRAVIAACGAAAESLASRFRPPRVEPLDIGDGSPEAVRASEAIAHLEPFRAFDPDGGPQDRETIRDYCMSTTSGPEAWASRWRTVHRRARQIVREHRHLIVALAREVFVKGVIRSKTIQEIAGALPAQPQEMK